MRLNHVAVLATAALGASAALADFSGQPILGPLGPGSFVTGNTTGHGDENDGFDSGIHIFDIWDGGDDVWQLDWPGGDMTVTLDSLLFSDNDLFVYSPGAYDSTGDYSIAGSHDVVSILGAAPGTYYINVDSTFFSEGAYELSVAAVPAPGAAGLMMVGGVLAMRRRRRA
ncbi:hypothetical protein PHYC_02496 [Phycisphaerales bacterium]|nr:hypothetical protein PHYC_02496 [Phycisphaerales bacterium]